MSKRVLECNICGEPLGAETDDELLVLLRRHIESEHGDAAFDEGQVRAAIASDAYEASDS